jgi:hypothetical protein
MCHLASVTTCFASNLADRNAGPLQPGPSASQHPLRQNSGARLPTLQIQRIGDSPFPVVEERVLQGSSAGRARRNVQNVSFKKLAQYTETTRAFAPLSILQ